MSQLAHEHVQHRNEVEEVEDDADPDGCPSHPVLHLLVIHKGRLEHHSVADEDHAVLVEALKEVVPAVVVGSSPADPDQVEHLHPEEALNLEELLVFEEDDEADKEKSPE